MDAENKVMTKLCQFHWAIDYVPCRQKYQVDLKESYKAIAVGNPEPVNKVYPHSTVGYSEALDVRKYI